MFIESWEISTSKFLARRMYELPPTGKPEVLYYPGATTAGGRDGPIVEVIPARGERWIAMFGDSLVGWPVNGLYIWPPDDGKFCVIANGGGYIVACDDPHNWSELKPLPVRGIFYFEDINSLVCYTFTDFYAWNQMGEAWHIGLAMDDINVTSIQGHVITGWYCDYPIEQVPFKLDAATGQLV